MTFDSNLVNRLLEAIFPLPDHFGMIVYDDQPDYPVDCDLLNELVHEVDEQAEICFGMSKLVITSPKLKNVVIKIPFNGYFTCFEGDEDNGEEDIFDWTSFCSAEGSDNSDYCLTEYEKFLALKKQHLNCFVAKTLLYKVYKGVRVFIQEKIISMQDSLQIYHPSIESQNLAKQWKRKERIYMDTEWIANCLDIYGETKVKKFLEYCSKIDSNILDDMHEGNYGYRENGTPALLDYSDYLD